MCKSLFGCYSPTQSSWIIHRISRGERERERVKFVRTSVCYELSRTVAGCPRFGAKFNGSSGSGFSPLFTPWLPSAQTIPTRQFSSSASTGMGENSPTKYTLHGSSLKTWMDVHPGRMAHQIFSSFFFFLLFSFNFVFHKLTKTKGGSG